MKVLVACEFTGTVRDAFIRAGHDAISCDLIASESDFGPHHQGDIMEFLDRGQHYDLGILHPDCTKMAVCGNGSWAGTIGRERAIVWTQSLWQKAKKYCKRVCLEQPVSALARRMTVKAQYIQPWQFGHTETKKTGLFLYNLPELIPTHDVYVEMMKLPLKERHKVWYASPGVDRGKDRSRFYPGFANAMSDQWGRAI